MSSVWKRCLEHLEGELTSQQFNTWIRPLHAVEEGAFLRLLAPNHFVRDWVAEHVLEIIMKVIGRCDSSATEVTIQVGSREINSPEVLAAIAAPGASGGNVPADALAALGLRSEFTFENFVEGKSNQMARAASMLVASNPGDTYNNPLFIYGDVGLGKTHLMHAIGNRMVDENPRSNVAYLHSEQFVAEMVTALQRNAINEFKKRYRSVDALLIDDIQFFAGKERSQEEFFHTFNRLLERERLVVLTSDRYPREIHGLESRLKTRFGGGLPVAIEPPELETRAAILMNKAEATNTEVPAEVAYFIAQRMQSNVRELEGALRRVIATGRVHRTLGHHRTGQGGAPRPSRAPGQARHHREHSAYGCTVLQDSRRRSHLAEAQSVHHQAETPRHGARQGTHEPQPAGNRRRIRWSRPHHGAVRVPQNFGDA